MNVKRNLSDLPVAPRDQGMPPNPNPKFVNDLAEHWYAQLGDTDLDRAVPEAGPYRASFAANRCDRQLMYALLEQMSPKPTDPEQQKEWDEAYGQSNPPSIADQWRFSLGHMVHDGIQTVMHKVHGGNVSVEPAVDLNPIGIPGSAHADLIILDDDGNGVCVVEYKSVNGFKFKMTVTTFKGPPEGPSSGHILQAAMVAVALDIPYFAIGYFSLENLSPSMASDFADSEIGRFAAEWRFKTVDYVDVVNREALRIQRILGDIETGTLTDRAIDDPEYPVGARIVEVSDPARNRKAQWQATDDDGVIVGTGSTWFCDYCPQRDRCRQDGPSS